MNYYLSDLADKLKLNKVNLVTSNPDFVILDVSSYGEILMDKLLDVSFSQIDVSTINVIDSLYKLFIGYADIDSIYGYLSVKTT
ncbi:Cfr10I/Bse634I family restriction endonuclease, partial [Escherichia coli]|nr:Cfr10I/Bse634I family restriction endonuclease [Escherichia coli]